MADQSTSGHQFSFSISGSLRNALEDSRSAQASVSGTLINSTMSNGVSAWQASRGWEEKTIALASGATVDIDLRDMAARDIGAGVGADDLGQSPIFEEIVGLFIEHVSGDGVLEINAALPTDPWAVIPLNYARNAFGGGLKLGGSRVWFEPNTQALDTVSAGANVRFGAASGDLVFRVLVIGRHDDDESSSSSISSSSQSSSSSSLSSTSASSESSS